MDIMKCKRIIILTILVLAILSFFLSSVYAQIWNIEFYGDITPTASKVSSKIRDTYLKDNYSNDISTHHNMMISIGVNRREHLQ